MKNKQSLTVFIPVTNLSAIWKGDFNRLPANSTYQLIIDYPLTHPVTYNIKTGKNGMGLISLLSKIGKLYEKTYQDDDDSDGEKHGIWGHDIGDLSLEGIDINHNRKTITLAVGS